MLAAQGLLGESKLRSDQRDWCINFLYFAVEVSFRTFDMCQMESSEGLEGIFPGGLINCSKKKPSEYIRFIA